jgi:hypothetical protein
MGQTILSNCHGGTLGTNANIMLNPQDANGNAVQANVYIKQNGTCIEWTFENYADGYVVAYWKTNNPPPNGQVYYSSGSSMIVSGDDGYTLNVIAGAILPNATTYSGRAIGITAPILPGTHAYVGAQIVFGVPGADVGTEGVTYTAIASSIAGSVLTIEAPGGDTITI